MFVINKITKVLVNKHSPLVTESLATADAQNSKAKSATSTVEFKETPLRYILNDFLGCSPMSKGLVQI